MVVQCTRSSKEHHGGISITSSQWNPCQNSLHFDPDAERQVRAHAPQFIQLSWWRARTMMSVLAVCLRTTKPAPLNCMEIDHNPPLCIYKDISNKHTYLSFKENHSHFHPPDKRRIDFLKFMDNLENTINIT